MNLTRESKRRPGAYIQFKSHGSVPMVSNHEGTAVLMVERDWGVGDQFVKVTANTNTKALLGKAIKDMMPIREALKGAQTVLVYLPEYENGQKAVVKDSDFTVTAKYAGIAGNTLSVIAVKNTDETMTYKTVFGTDIVVEQVVAKDTLPASNAFVDFTGTALTSSKTIKLAGGTNGILKNTAIQQFLNGLDYQDFSHVALSSEDQTLKALALDKVHELRALGYPVTLVTNDYAADDEAVISVANGVTLASGEILTAKEVVYWLAAAQSSAGTKSLTYAIYPEAIDADRKTNQETIDLLNSGHVVFTFKHGKVVLEQDINTLVTYTTEKNADFSKNKLMRTLAIMERQIKQVFDDDFVGKFPNTIDGRELLKQQIITQVLDPLVAVSALTFDAQEMVIEQGTDKESVVINLGVTLTGAMEKLFVTVELT